MMCMETIEGHRVTLKPGLNRSESQKGISRVMTDNVLETGKVRKLNRIIESRIVNFFENFAVKKRTRKKLANYNKGL